MSSSLSSLLSVSLTINPIFGLAKLARNKLFFLNAGSKRMETTHKLFDYVIFIIQSSLRNSAICKYGGRKS